MYANFDIFMEEPADPMKKCLGNWKKSEEINDVISKLEYERFSCSSWDFVEESITLGIFKTASVMWLLSQGKTNNFQGFPLTEHNNRSPQKDTRLETTRLEILAIFR